MGDWEKILEHLAQSDMSHGGYFRTALNEITALREKCEELQRQLQSEKEMRAAASRTRDEMTDKYHAEKDRADGLRLVLQRERDEAARQEPAAYIYPAAFGSHASLAKNNKPSDWDDDERPWYEEPLYRLPPSLPALIEQAKAEERERLGKLIHYPECWDTACYRTMDDALTEIGCNPDCCTRSEK